MTEMNQRILDMIAKNASVNEICSVTGLSNKQLFYRLNMFKVKGFDFSRKYYEDGEITYKLNKGFKEDHDISLITSPKTSEIKIAFLSDLHLSNEHERLDLLNEVYNFCANENIHVIINGGDLIDGLIGPDKKKHSTYEKQIDYAIKNHPFDKNILNFICLGNHDHKALEITGQNLETALLNRRHDIVPLGYGYGKLNIKNDEIVVRHPKTPTTKMEPTTRGLIVTGHSHRSQSSVIGNIINIGLPSLSSLENYTPNESFSLPGFIVGKISFYKGFFQTGIFEQYVFLDKVYKVNELNYELIKGASLNDDVIKYEEERVKKTYVKEMNRKSQFDKFKDRYNK